LSRDSILLSSIALGLALACAAPAGAALRSARFAWAPATGPVQGYVVYAAVDGGPEEVYAYVSQPSAAITIDSGESLVVSVAAFDMIGQMGPRSDHSAPLRLCPGDFDGDRVVGSADWGRVRGCLGQEAEDACAAGDIDDDGSVSEADLAVLKIGSDACSYLPAAAGCPGDTNGDGWITTTDLGGVRQCIGLMPLGNCAYADLDGSGIVTAVDLALSMRAIGTRACP
jgi:hypothetical protein